MLHSYIFLTLFFNLFILKKKRFQQKLLIKNRKKTVFFIENKIFS